MRFTIIPQLAVDGDASELIPNLVFTLLQEIEDGSNLTVAAKNAGVSYRKAWNLMSYWSARLNSPLVESARGRGAELATLGAKLLSVKRYADVQGDICLQDAINHIQSEMDSVLRQTIDSSDRVTVSASDCVCLDVLKNLYQGETSTEFSLDLFGSQSSLNRLHDERCQIAGFHLAAGSLKQGYCQSFRKIIDLSSFSAVRSHQRMQGLIVAPGNPLALESISDLARPAVRIVNRQSGSGTRVLFDLLARDAGLTAKSFRGYKDVEQTHTAVCARVAKGQVDVALGTKGAAAQFGLDFVPLVNENYYFGFLKTNFELTSVQNLIHLLGTPVWARAIDLMPGMTAEGAGVVIEEFEG